MVFSLWQPVVIHPLADDPAVAHGKDPVKALHHPPVMGDDQDGGMVLYRQFLGDPITFPGNASFLAGPLPFWRGTQANGCRPICPMNGNATADVYPSASLLARASSFSQR